MLGEIQNCRIMKVEVIQNKTQDQSKFENEVEVQCFDGFNEDRQNKGDIVSVEAKLWTDSLFIKSPVQVNEINCELNSI